MRYRSSCLRVGKLGCCDCYDWCNNKQKNELFTATAQSVLSLRSNDRRVALGTPKGASGGAVKSVFGAIMRIPDLFGRTKVIM